MNTPPLQEHMSKPEAVATLLRLATKRSMTVDEVEALYMGARHIVKKHMQRMKNFARRRENPKAVAASEEG